MSGADASNADHRPLPESASPFVWAVWLAVGPHVRLALAFVLLAACACWVSDNGFGSVGEDGRPAVRPLAVEGLPAGADGLGGRLARRRGGASPARVAVLPRQRVRRLSRCWARP